MNGWPQYKFTPAISFVVNCESQQEVDDLWEKLQRADEKRPLRWAEDALRAPRQIVPTILSKLLQDKDPEKSKRVMQAMLQMGQTGYRQIAAGI